jgi:PAS domain S-box-containing protein
MPEASILIVEDEAVTALNIQEEVKALGYGIAGVAHKGEQAIKLAQDRYPDLVLMDINLNGKMDGIDAAMLIKERHPIPIVFITALVDDATLQRAKLCEPNGYLVKPIMEDNLRTTIENALNKFRLESQLRKSEAQYRELFETSLDGIVITDQNGKLIRCNPAFSRLVGYSIDELASMTVAGLTPPEYLEMERQLIVNQVIARGYSDEFSKEYLHSCGERVPANVRIWARKDAENQLIGFWGLIRDVTAQQAAEQRIHKQSEFANTLVKLTNQVNECIELSQLLETICKGVSQALDVEGTRLSLYEAETNSLRVAYSVGPIQSAELSMISVPVATYERYLGEGAAYLYIPDVQVAIPDHPHFPFVSKHNIRSAVSVKLAREGRLIGSLEVGTIGRIRHFSEEELTFLKTFANQAAIAIDHARLYQQMRNRANELEILAKLSSTLRQAITPQEMLPTILKVAMELAQAEAGILYLLGPAGNPIDRFEYSRLGLEGEEWFTAGGSLWARGLASEQPVYDPAPIPGNTPMPGQPTLKTSIVARLLVPLRSTNTLAAMMALGYTHPRRLLDHERSALLSLAEMGGNALHRSGLMEMLEKRVTDRTRELRSLYDLTVFVNSPIDLAKKLSGAIQKLRPAVGADCGVIYRYHAEDGCLLLEAQVDMPGEMLPKMYQLSLSAGRREWLETSNTPWLISTEAEQAGLFQNSGMGSFRTVINLPIRFEGKTLGLLCVFWKQEIDLAAENVALLIAVAERIGSAIQNDILLEKAEKTALLEERQRLARELHDSVTQSLYSLTLFAEAGRDLLAQKELARLDSCLGELSQSSLQALKEMRLLIFELRPPVLGERDLARALQERLDAVERRAGVSACLEMDADVLLPARMQEELFSVVKEALNNSLKHSRAESVWVKLGVQQNRLELSIEDNGHGFDREEAQRGGMGLTTMRERVERLGGRLEIQSNPGSGTRVVVQLEAAG